MVYNHGGTWHVERGKGVGGTHESSWDVTLKGIGMFVWISKT